jgi:hypothetical protein
MQPLVFVILRHAQTSAQDMLWKRCHASVQEFHPEIPIVVISDNCTYSIEGEYPNTSFITSEFPCAGEVLPYYYFLRHKWAERMVFLHDSMILIHPLNFTEINEYPIKFLWHFTIHCCDDNKVIVPLIKSLPNNAPLLIMYANTSAWDGCFGVASTIRLDFLQSLEEDYKLFSTVIQTVKNRDHRMAMERIFAVAVYTKYPFPRNRQSICGCIHDMPFRWTELNEQTLGILKNTYPYPIVKSWYGR